MRNKHDLEFIFTHLLKVFGPRRWWPGRSRFEIILGAILTQNVSWKNAKKCIDNLKTEKLLNITAIHNAAESRVASLIVPSRYYKQKAKKIKILTQFIYDNYNGSLSKMFQEDMEHLRKKLLSIYGIGPETADCILLYAGGKASFVSDAYTHRFLKRYGLLKGKIGYDRSRNYFMKHIPVNAKIYNEFHALIVHLGYDYCKKSPICQNCPVRIINQKIKCQYASKI